MKRIRPTSEHSISGAYIIEYKPTLTKRKENSENTLITGQNIS